MKFHGSRNFTEEHVSDLMWEGEVGTTIIVKIVEENKVEVEIRKEEENG